MKHRNLFHPFLLTIPALLVLACDPSDTASEPVDDIAAEEAPTAEKAAVVAAPVEEYEVDEDDFPPKPRPEGAQERMVPDGPEDISLMVGTILPGKPPVDPDKDLLVALVGDMGSGSNPRAVYKLILEEKADFAIIPGDFDYKNSPKTFESDINAVLGADYPIFPAVGNHDKSKWKEYQANFQARLKKIDGAVCTGDLGSASSCTYRGLHFVLSGIAVTGSKKDHEKYIAAALEADSSPWSLCVWHKNQTDFQAGDKPDDIGWTAFQHCQKDGSIIVMAHEHSYARTRTLTDIGGKGHGATGMPDLLEVGPGSTFAVVTGLGGKSIRAWESKVHKSDTWWGTLYTSNYYRKNGEELKKSSANQGALFIRFNVGGDPSAAEGYFKTVDGDVIDEFDIVRK